MADLYSAAIRQKLRFTKTLCHNCLKGRRFGQAVPFMWNNVVYGIIEQVTNHRLLIQRGKNQKNTVLRVIAERGRAIMSHFDKSRLTESQLTP